MHVLPIAAVIPNFCLSVNPSNNPANPTLEYVYYLLLQQYLGIKTALPECPHVQFNVDFEAFLTTFLFYDL